jgi:TRAP-type C4-dicarboxylate transport system permease small subunit
MLLTAADVFARYVLASPIRGAYEFVQTLLAVGMFASLPLVGLRGEHISVRLIESERLGTLGRWVDLALLAVSTMVFVFLAHRLWLLADLVGSNEQTLGAMAIPLDPLYRSMSILAGLAALVTALMVAPTRFMRAEGENSP